MRRSEKEVTDRAEIDAVIRSCRVCRLGLSDDGQPYVVPLSFGYDGEALYFHSATEGRKLDILRKSNRVCVESDILEGLEEADEACAWGIRYRSVIGTGSATILEDTEEKKKAFTVLMSQYSDRDYSFPDKTVARTTVVKIVFHSLTGKQSRRG